MANNNKEVIIIGTGPSGLCAGVQIQRMLGHQNIQYYERSPNMGGTWLHNTYPGAAVDIPAHFYSYSFAMKPDWPKVYPNRRDLLTYFNNIAEEYDLKRRMTFNTECIGMTWDHDRSLWVVQFQKTGDPSSSFEREASVVVCAIGKLDLPKIPNIKGRDTFKGAQWHSSRWDHSVDTEGKNIVVLGNGASGTQFMPKLSKKAGHLTQIVHSAHYITPRKNPHYSPLFKWAAANIPGVCRMYRWSWAVSMDYQFTAFFLNSFAEYRRKHLAKETTDYIDQVAPEEYKAILTPDYLVGCRRRVHSNRYLEILNHDNVELLLDDVVEITEDTVIMKSGKTIPADIIIYATGFRVEDWMWPMTIRGIDGVQMHDVWKERGGVQAYFGTAHDQFPNWFTLYGPNTGSGHNSVIHQTECQVNFMCRMLKPVLRGSAKSVVPKKEAQLALNARLQRQLPKLTFATGCTSWFLTKDGQNFYHWPNFCFTFWLETLRVKWGEVKVDYPGKHGYISQGTGPVPNTVLVAGAVMASLLALNAMRGNSVSQLNETLKSLPKQLSSAVKRA